MSAATPPSFDPFTAAYGLHSGLEMSEIFLPKGVVCLNQSAGCREKWTVGRARSHSSTKALRLSGFTGMTAGTRNGGISRQPLSILGFLGIQFLVVAAYNLHRVSLQHCSDFRSNITLSTTSKDVRDKQDLPNMYFWFY